MDPYLKEYEDMHVDVITRHAIRNYGSVLQAVATRELLSGGGASVRFIDYRQPGYDDTGWSLANRGSARNFPLPARAAYAALRDPGAKKIGRVFEKFLRDEFALTNRSYVSAEGLGASEEFAASSVYCVGSDQVWNIEYNVDNSPYYLDFAPRGARRFSLSSSIGAASLPRDEERRLIDALGSYAGVSVREKDAASYLEALGVHAEHHVDPTLGVQKAFWEAFAGGESARAPYILVYQLNGMSHFNPVVDAVSTALALPARRVEYWRGPRTFRYAADVLPTPQEFVRLFRDASFVVTDSFHGTVFSTKFGKPFVAVAPPRYSGRISSLLELTGESHRLAASPAAAVDIARHGGEVGDAEVTLSTERKRLQTYIARVLS